MKTKGLTLLEIIVSVMILAVVMFGLANLFVAGKGFIQHSKSRMTGGELGKYILDPLQMEVRQDTWNDAGNQLLGGTTRTSTNTVGIATYTATYTPQRGVQPPGESSPVGVNKVKADITWTELR